MDKDIKGYVILVALVVSFVLGMFAIDAWIAREGMIRGYCRHNSEWAPCVKD